MPFLVHGRYAEFLTDQGRYEEAEHHFERAIELDRKCFVNLINYGRMQVRRKDEPNDEFAEFLVRKAIEISPEDAEGHYRLGNVLGCQGALEEAATCLRRALELDPRHPRARGNLDEVLAAIAKDGVGRPRD